jgi:transposase, IS5 family
MSCHGQVAAIEPVYPKTEGLGRPPVGVERILRLHDLQQWFNLLDLAVEAELYDSRAMRQLTIGQNCRLRH